MTLLNEKNYSIYTIACNEHMSEATNATIMPYFRIIDCYKPH